MQVKKKKKEFVSGRNAGLVIIWLRGTGASVDLGLSEPRALAMEPGPGCVGIADTLIREPRSSVGGLSAKRAAGSVSPHNNDSVTHGDLHLFSNKRRYLTYSSLSLSNPGQADNIRNDVKCRRNIFILFPHDTLEPDASSSDTEVLLIENIVETKNKG